MVRHAILSAALALAALIGGCATNDDGKGRPAGAYTGGDMGRLSADQTECRKQASNIDYNSADAYSDSKYGATAAMAAAVAQDNPERPMGKATQDAAFESCMDAKGWKRAPSQP